MKQFASDGFYWWPIIQPSEHFLYLLDLSEYHVFPEDPPCLPLKWSQFILSNCTFIRSRCEWWLSGKETTCNAGDTSFIPWVGKIPWRRAWQSTPVFLPGESHGQRSLAGYSPWGCKELDRNEQLTYTPNIITSRIWSKKGSTSTIITFLTNGLLEWPQCAR